MMRIARTRERAGRRARWSGEDGVSLVELMVAMTILLIVMVGFSSSMISALELNRSNRSRIVAANIASEQISTIQSLNFGAIEGWLVAGGADVTVEAGGLDYVVTRDAQMVFADAEGNACDSPTGGGEQPAYLRVTVLVTWPGMGKVQPVRSETVITPPVSSYDPYAGHLAVKLTRRDTSPSLGHVVDVQATEGGLSRQQTVSVQGCAFFANLPPGNYNVSVQTANHVDRATGQQQAQVQAPVKSAETYAVEINYDHAATLRITLAGAQGGTVPPGVPVTVANENVNVLGYKSFPDNRGGDAFHSVAPLYPFSDGYTVWGGRCPDADPAHQTADGSWAYPGAQRQTAASNPNETTELTVTVASVLVSAQDGFGNPAAGETVLARPAYQPEPDPEDPEAEQPGCDSGDPVVVSLDAGAQWLVALPYGSWTFWAQGADSSVTATLAPGAGGAHSVVVVTDG